MLKFLLIFILFSYAMVTGSTQTFSDVRLRNLKECLEKNVENTRSNSPEKEPVFKSCFLQSIQTMSVDSMILLIREDQDFYTYFSKIRAQLARECTSFYQFLEKTKQAMKNQEQETQIGSTVISPEVVSPDAYKVLVLDNDSTGVLVKVIYEDRPGGKSARPVYPLYQNGTLSGYTNSKPFRIKYEQLEQSRLLHDEPNIQHLNVPVAQYRPEKFNIEVHKNGFIYPLDVEVMRKQEAKNGNH